MAEETKVHFLYCPMTGLGLRGGYRGDQWLKYRIQIFLWYVVPALTSQENKNFYLWMSWRPEEKKNPIVLDFIEQLKRVRDLGVVHTFHGVCFWDDRYSDEEASGRLRYALQNSLPELKHIVGDAQWVLMSIQPSDDAYLPFMVRDMQSTTLAERAVGYREGMILNIATKEMAEYSPSRGWVYDGNTAYNTDTDPPFYTIMFPRETFLDPVRHYVYIGPYKSHEQVKYHMKYDFFEKRGFVVGVHGANISTNWNHRYQGRMLTDAEKLSIMTAMGTLFSDPIIVRKTWRAWLRKIANVLPFNLGDMARAVYHKVLPRRWKVL